MTSELGSVLLCRARRRFSFLSIYPNADRQRDADANANAYSTAAVGYCTVSATHATVFALGVHWNTYGSEPSALAHRSTGTW